ncbi:MAG: hypothetical protein H6835_09330 [Planctomycetes bacterium]|nr:hypothetical protein [Planctomycetota bacterium]
MNGKLILLAALAIPAALSAQVVASDNFSYTGALTANGWTAHSGGGNKVIMANGSTARLEQGSGSGEDINIAFPAFGATDVIYASFTFNVPSGGQVVTSATGSYWAHVKTSGTFYHARVGFLTPTSGGDFILAISDTSDMTAGVSWPTELSFDTDYSVVVSWDAGTGENKLWLNPWAEASPSLSVTGAFTGDLIEGFALRQASNHTGFIDVDNVVVGHTFADVFCASPNSIVKMATPDCATASLDVTGSPLAGGTILATVSGGTIPVVIVSTVPVNIPLLPFFGCDCIFVPNLDVFAVGGAALSLPVGLPAGLQFFMQGVDVTVTPGAASPCDLGGGLYVGVTDAACVITG